MATIADNLQAVKLRIRRAAEAAGRDPESVRLLAVSKTHAAPLIASAADAGQQACGENYVQEAVEKMAQLPGSLEWHLIGPVQSNKTRLAAERFDWVHTVANEKIARRLSEQRPDARGPLNVLVQVNVSREDTKSGAVPEDLFGLVKNIAGMKQIRLRGLMAIPEPGAPGERFREVRRFYDELKGEYAFDTLSMGMSDDMELAIAEGSTLVRIGTAIFGARERAVKSEYYKKAAV
jgi:pyridoxal phosphate enzyme (YggS family)